MDSELGWIFMLRRPFWYLSRELGVGWKTFQNLKVSSAAALATVVPSGLSAKCNTLLVWPRRSAIFFMVGYFQMHSWLLMKPCEDKISLSKGFHCKAHTYESVCTEFTIWPVSVFQNLMHWSLEPPPEASKFFCQGHHEMALTAALWSRKQYRGL